MAWQLPIGANPDRSGVFFRVWADGAQQLEVVTYDAAGEATGATPMEAEGAGYWAARVADAAPGTLYKYRLDGDKERPDPASRSQPQGIHGPSAVVAPDFDWHDNQWRGVRIEDALIYELHIGTFTPDGTFDAAIARLADLRALGVTVIEIMPVADFPGERNWGYDGVNLFAPARVYGGAAGLKRLVDAAHAQGLAVMLDAVYNHFGPDGNYLRDFSPDYFTDKHKTPWGDGLNFENPNVRAFFIANAQYWAHEYHLDGLRLDATHAILDSSDPHILKDLVMQVKKSLPDGRHFLMIAEDERNEAMLVRSQPHGYGLDGLWADDFHHEVRSALAGDNEGYYADYVGSAEELAITLRKGWYFDGIVSQNKGELRGTPARDISPARFVHTIQNHDQIGNRPTGNRLNHDIPPADYRAASALLLLTPYTPLLFQGQEWAASTPFIFFTDHNPELGKLVTEGRREEFKGFAAFSGESVPDPQADATFLRSKLDWDERAKPEHSGTLALYTDLLRLRNELQALGIHDREHFEVTHVGDNAVLMRRDSLSRNPADALLIVLVFKDNLTLTDDVIAPPKSHRWQVVLSSEDAKYGGAGIAENGTLHGAQTVLYRAVFVPPVGA